MSAQDDRAWRGRPVREGLSGASPDRADEASARRPRTGASAPRSLRIPATLRPAAGLLPVLDRSFFRRDPVTCAREMIGCELVWKSCAGVIVETEAYAVINDEACHTFARPSARAFVAKHPPGTAYVYFNYGMYWLLNVLVKGGTEDGFVLFRAIEPTRGLAAMQRRRTANLKSEICNLHSLCSGPGKLAMALGVDGRDHGRDLCRGSTIGFRAASEPVDVAADVRIGISKAAHLPWRFLARGSCYVSVRHSDRE